jgi:hypothetical protein
MDIEICDSEEENNSSEVGEVDKNSEIPELPQTLETSIHTDPNPHDIPPVPVYKLMQLQVMFFLILALVW